MRPQFPGHRRGPPQGRVEGEEDGCGPIHPLDDPRRGIGEAGGDPLDALRRGIGHTHVLRLGRAVDADDLRHPPDTHPNSRSQMLRKLTGGLGSPWACRRIGASV